MTQSVQPGKPAYPAGSIYGRGMANDAARLCSFGGGRFTHGCSNHFSTDEPGGPGALKITYTTGCPCQRMGLVLSGGRFVVKSSNRKCSS